MLLYDGVCGLCNQTVRFVLRRDRRKIFQFAALQSAYAVSLLAKQHRDATDLDTTYIVVSCDDGDVLFERSDAALFVLRQIGGTWGLMARLFRLFPRRLRDWMYDVVAHHRYRVFGKYETCPLPGEEDRDRFIGL